MSGPWRARVGEPVCARPLRERSVTAAVVLSDLRRTIQRKQGHAAVRVEVAAGEMSVGFGAPVRGVRNSTNRPPDQGGPQDGRTIVPEDRKARQGVTRRI